MSTPNPKKIFLTGSSAGFGRNTAMALAERGHTVYASMRGIDGKNASVAAELRDWAAKGGHALHVIECDVTSDASVEAAVAKAMGLGGIDVLINNAGVGNWGIDEGFDVSQAERVFSTNVFGVMRMNRVVLPHFRKAKSGLIIYISSGLGRIVLPFLAIYTSSKFAIEGYAEGLSYELAPLGIQSVIVQPGAYGTTFLANTFQPAKPVAEMYGPTAKMFEIFGGGFEERAKAGGLGDPTEITRALVEEVEHAGGKRPLRRTVGEDVKVPVAAINQTCEQVQGQLFEAFGLA